MTEQNKKVTIPYEYEIRRSFPDGSETTQTYLRVYTFELEPVVRRLYGRLINTWRAVPIDRLTEDEVMDYLHFDRWVNQNTHKIRQLGQWEALHIFKEEIFSLAHDHIRSGNEPEYWEGLLDMVRKQDDLKMKQKIEHAREFPMIELVRRLGFEPRMGFIQCPFHGERTGSLKIYKNSWYCFGCNEGSSTIDFVMKHNNMDFKDAVDFLN